METITIRDVGPITSHTLSVAPGITVLTGKNEAGKSTAVACVAALAGRDDLDLEPRDGTKSGLVEGLGTTLLIGRRTVRTGDLEVESLEDRLDLGQLVEPALKDGKAANRRRIRGLLSLTGTTLDLRDFQGILPAELQDEITTEDYDDDPVEMAAKIKRKMDKKARANEDEAHKQEGKAIALADRLKGRNLDEPHDEAALQAQAEAAISKAAALKSQADAYLEATKARDEAAEELAAINATVYGEREAAAKVRAQAEADKVALDKVANDRALALADIRAKVNELEDQYAKLENQQKQTRAERGMAIERLAAADATLADKEARLGDAKTLGELVAKGLPPKVTQGQLDAANEAKQAALLACTRGAEVRELISVKALLANARKLQADALRQAEVFRNAGRATDEVLSAAVACETLKVVEGELTYVEGDRKEPYARLSDGKRYQVAIVEIAKAIKRTKGRVCILPLSQQAWEGLDDGNREIVRASAVANGVAIVTAEHSGSVLDSYRWGTK